MLRSSANAAVASERAKPTDAHMRTAFGAEVSALAGSGYNPVTRVRHAARSERSRNLYG